MRIRVITKSPKINPKVQNKSENRYDITGVDGTAMVLTWYRLFKRSGGINLGFAAHQTLSSVVAWICQWWLNSTCMFSVIIGKSVIMSLQRKKYKKQSIPIVSEGTEYFSTKDWYLKNLFDYEPFETHFPLSLIQKSVTPIFIIFEGDRVVSTCSTVANQLWNINTICTRLRYIATKVRTTYNF